MYKCRECGTKYNQKPTYCECGNDTFEEIIDNNTQFQNSQIDEDNFDNDIEDCRSFEKIDTKIQNIPPHYNNSQVQTNSNNIISTIIFSLCLILSFIILFFVGNPKQETPQITKDKQNTLTTKEIPPIDSFWDNSQIKVESPVVEQKPQQTPKTVEIPVMPQNIQQIIPQTPPKTIQQKPTLKATTMTTPKTKQPTTKTTTNQTQKNSNPSNNISKTNTSTNDLMQRIKNNQTQTKTVLNSQTPQLPQTNTQKTTSQQSTNPTPKTINSAPVPKVSTQSTQQTTIQNKPQTTTRNYAAEKQELTNYKISLRNTIGRRIDFTRVVGDGSCSLSFKIDQNGRLINRTFTKQSSNITLNEAVYNAMNSITSFNPPPTGYKSETLNLTIKFYNGNFEISLI